MRPLYSIELQLKYWDIMDELVLSVPWSVEDVNPSFVG